MKLEFYESMPGFARHKTDNGELVVALASCEESLEVLTDQIDMTIDFNDYFLEKFFEKLNEKYENIGCLVKIEVEEHARGTGFGRELMDVFEREVSSNTDIDILFARIDNKQSSGFSLKKFYEDRGYEGIRYEDGSLLMVNKGQANELINELGLKKREPESSMSF